MRQLGAVVKPDGAAVDVGGVICKGQALGISAETAAHPSLLGALLVW